MLNVHRLIANTEVEGPGRRFAIWTQGCSRQCDGCFATDTWAHEANTLIDPVELAERINGEPNIEGVTILGGEPLEQAQEIVSLLRALRPSLSRILFTGYVIEELQNTEDEAVHKILNMVDVLVDGEYQKDLRDLSRPMVGSTNQRFLFLTDRYSYHDFPRNEIEIRLSRNGTVLVNGNGDIVRIAVE